MPALPASARWSAKLVSGGVPLVSRAARLSLPLLASADGKHSIVCMAHQLRVYFLHTRQCIRTIDLDLQAAVAVRLDPLDDRQVIVFYPDRVLHVNWKERVETPVVATQSLAPALPALAHVADVSETHYHMLCRAEIDNNTPAARHRVLLVRIDRELARATELWAQPSGNAAHFALSHDAHKLAIVCDGARLKNDAEVQLYDLSAVLASAIKPKDAAAAMDALCERFAHDTRSVTCVAVANSGVVALGTSWGAISLLYGGAAQTNRKSRPLRTLRWHMDAVLAVAFSADDVYLLSGGHEKVLVFWHLELDRTQFLPRLSGAIDGLYVDLRRPDHYTATLRTGSDGTNAADSPHEVVVLSAVDLASRLNVAPLCPATPVPLARALAVARRKNDAARDSLGLHHDITAKIAVHTSLGHLYFTRGAAVQAYDVPRGEQAFVQHVAPPLATGKVKSEHQLADPEVSAVSFTPDGQWMATFDATPSAQPDDLMLHNDVAYALKFWRLVDSAWLLALKIVDPHGAGRAVGAIVSLLSSLFTTVDVFGGIREWRPRANHVGGPAKLQNLGRPAIATQTVWTLRRASPPTPLLAPVAVCYSADSSLLVVAHGNTVKVHDPALLLPTPYVLPRMDAPVESLAISGPYLVMALLAKLLCYDLVRGCETPLFARLLGPGLGNLVAVGNGQIFVAVNRLTAKGVSSQLLVFKPESLTPIFSQQHKLAVLAVCRTPLGFVFVDGDKRIGTVSQALHLRGLDAQAPDIASQMAAMLASAQAAANLLSSRPVNENKQEDSDEDVSKWTSSKLLDVGVFQPLFANIEGLSLDTLFDRVVRAVQ